MRIHALVLAGGSGDRFGAEMPKQFVRLAGEPILSRTVRAVAAPSMPCSILSVLAELNVMPCRFSCGMSSGTPSSQVLTR